MSAAESTVFVTGVPTEFANRDGSPTPRLEIYELMKDARQWSLYIQALNAMQNAPERLVNDAESPKKDTNGLPVNPLSWFGIASIHGQPYVTWNKAPHFVFDTDTKKTQPRGYCRHGSTLFPTWHRAYLALFEQALHSQAQRIVKDYEKCLDFDQWKEAARTLRAPYWDWSKNLRPPREVYDVESYDAKKPTLNLLALDDQATSTTHKDLPNPLLWYEFKVPPQWEVTLDDRKPSLRWDHQRTLRHTYKNKAGLVLSNPIDFETTLDAYNPRDHVYYTLTENKKWLDFSNHTYHSNNAGRPGQAGNKWDRLKQTGNVKASEVVESLETIHDSFHDNLGGAGFMSRPEVAAFDPIFWLHHANVDRLFALWQELHPGVWVEPFMETEGRTGANLGTYDVKSPLLPFWKDGGTAEKPLKFWTSADEGIRDWTKLNYTYPDFIGLPQDAQERQLRLNGVINSDYGRDVLAWQNRLRLRLPPLVPAPRIEATVADHPTFLRSEPFTMQTQFEEIVVNSKVSANCAAMQMATPHPHKRMATAKEIQESRETVHADGPVVAEPVATFGQQSSSTDRQPGALRNSFTDWRIRVRAARFALNMGYTVLLFLGIPSEDVAEWRTDPNLVGMHSAFTNMSAPKCENCVDQADAMDISINNITLPLIDRGQDIDDVEQIKQYVETNLHWRIQKIDGTLVEPSAFPSLITDVLSVSMVWSDAKERFVPDKDNIIARGDWGLTS